MVCIVMVYICESLLGTLLNMKIKSKDNIKSRKDLQEMGIRNDLHPKQNGDRTLLPASTCNLLKSEKQIFCERLKALKLSDGYCSNISCRVSSTDYAIYDLKSHDYHVLMQQLLPMALRNLLPKGPRNAIFKLCSFYNELCQWTIDLEKMESIEDEVVVTMCLLERYFPPFFDIMVHLTLHLVREVCLGGPVQFRWMYAFERYMKDLKASVRNHLTTPWQAEGILNLIEDKWKDLVGNMPLKICYPALEFDEWRIITGSDPKNIAWSYHNGVSWPTLLWQVRAHQPKGEITVLIEGKEIYVDD